MVTTLAEYPSTQYQSRTEDAILNRLNVIVSRIDSLAQVTHETRERLERVELHFDEAAVKQNQALDSMERRIEQGLDDRIQGKLPEMVRHVVQPEIGVLRAPLEAQSVRLAAVENRLERVESIQVESMNALDVRFGDLAYQTRLALSAGGLVTLGAIMVVLLR